MLLRWTSVGCAVRTGHTSASCSQHVRSVKRAVRPRPLSEDVLDEAQAAFQQLSSEPFTREDTREAFDNLGRFFEVLERWAREDAQKGHGPFSRWLGDTHPSRCERRDV